MNKLPKQIVGNIGLYYTCCELSKRGWNVMITSRNARGPDIIIYSQSAERFHTIQVKSLRGRNPVSISKNPISEYIIICRRVLDLQPEIFIAMVDEIRSKIKEHVNEAGEKSCWLEMPDYETFEGRWDKLGDPQV